MGDLMILTRSVHFASLVWLTGIFAFLEFVAKPALFGANAAMQSGATAFRARLIRLAWPSLAVVFASGLLWLVLEAMSMSGKPLMDVLSRQAIISTVLARTRFGHDWELRALLLICLTALACAAGLVSRRRAIARYDRAVLLLSGIMLAAIAWAGHAAGTAGWQGYVHLACDAVHLLAAGAWLGGLVPLAVLFAAARRSGNSSWAQIARTATARFSMLGLIIVGTLLVTGLVNAWFLVGTIPALMGTAYGHLLLIKLGLFVAMVGVAAVNRLKLTPRLALASHAHNIGANWTALRQLQRNALIEIALGVIILAVVGALGTTPPALHSQPWWPFPYRLSLEALVEAPEIRNQVIATAALGLIGLAFVFRGILWSRYRQRSIVLGLVLCLAFGWRAFDLLAVKAYPTTFQQSPAPFTALSIARGAHTYAQHCTVCHGADGRGDGPAAKDLKVMPADLTAAHLFGHSDGDLFWWISYGTADGVMPGFAAMFDGRQRWDIINFIHARAAGMQSGDMSAEVAAFPGPVAPDFTFEWRDRRQGTLMSQRTRGPVLLVFFTMPGSRSRLEELDHWRSSLAQMGLSMLAVPAQEPAGAGRGQRPLPDFVVTADPEVPAAYALFERRKHRAAASHVEFLIDRSGRLRARWQPGDLPDWGDTGNLHEQVSRLQRLPAAPIAPGAHVH